MKPSKRLAGVVALATVAAGVSVIVGAGAANAAAPGTLTCNTGGNGSAFASTWNDTNTFTLSPAGVLPGGTITATWTSAAGLVNGSPAPLTADSTQVQVAIALSGGLTGNVLATTTPSTYPAVTTANGVALGPINATATFTAPASGTVNATVSFIDFNSNSVDTYCSTSTANTQFPATGSAYMSFINTPNFQSPHPATGIGDAGSFTTSNPNYNDIQVSAGAVAFGSASTTVDAAVVTPTAVTGQAAGVTSYGRASSAGPPPVTNAITVTGSGWDASQAAGAFTVTFDAAAATSAVSTDTSGNLSGTINIPVGEAAGVHTVNVVDSAHAKSFTFTVLGTQTLTISPAAGGAGTSVTLNGANWNPTGATILAGVTSAHAVSADGQVTVNATATGTIPTTIYVVNASNTTYLGATQAAAFGAPIGIPGGNSIYTAFAFSSGSCIADTGNVTGGSCSINQTVLASVLAGNLSMQQTQTGANPAAGTIQLCSVGYAGARDTASGKVATCAVPSNTTSTPMTGQLNQVTVTDVRGGVFGWSLTSALQNANFTTLSGTAGTIPAADLAIAGITCAVDASVPGSASGITAGTGGTYATSQSLCVKDATTFNSGGSTSGQYLVNTPVQGLTLTVPAFQVSGNYSNTLVITLT